MKPIETHPSPPLIWSSSTLTCPKSEEERFSNTSVEAGKQESSLELAKETVTKFGADSYFSQAFGV
jgi:hypothetical protein